ncbi:MAG TPA: zf-HC2 domain-containing protein [Thermoanaerobaculia bacterium]|nr:zf-HC2 domain-containing protein [Thermoanaerobaculia bacterium]
MLMTDCPTEETLAAFVDDRLDAATRQKVIEHLATCGECRELVMMATDYQESETLDNVATGTFGRRGWVAAVAGLAAAAVLAIFVLRPSFVFGPDMEDVIAASQELERRPSVGRMAEGFPHQDGPRINRGDSNDEEFGQPALLHIAAHAKDPHVSGVTLLLLTEADPAYYKDAVVDLNKAYEMARTRGRDHDLDAISIDLAAALLAPWAAEKDYEKALMISEDVLKRKQRPEAAWNRAVALELLRRDSEAVQAWNGYLRLDPKSQWAVEAAQRKESLTESLAPKR